MVFSMQEFVNVMVKRRQQLYLLLSAAVLVAALITLQFYPNCCLPGHGVDIKSATLDFKNGNATLNADIDYHFSKTALQALENGIPLPLDVEVVVKSQRKWMWDKTEWHIVLAYQIRYLALSKSYELINESSGSRRNFASRGVAIDALGRIRGMPVAKSYCPQADDQCHLLIKVSLNREGLPLPLRPGAYVTLDWYLSSRWRKWPLTS